MSLPEITQPTWLSDVEMSATQGLSNLADNIISDLGVIQATVVSADGIRKQVVTKAADWLKGVKAGAGTALNSLDSINSKINEFKSATSNTLQHSDLQTQGSSTIKAFLSSFTSAGSLVLGALVLVPNLPNSVVPSIKSLLQNLITTTEKDGDAVLAHLSNLTPPNQTKISAFTRLQEPVFTETKESTFTLLQGFITSVNTNVTQFGLDLKNLPDVSANPDVQSGIGDISADFDSLFKEAGYNVLPTVQTGLDTLEKQRPIRLINLNPVTGGLTSLADALINALGSDDPSRPVED